MWAFITGTKVLLLRSALLCTCPFLADATQAAQPDRRDLSEATGKPNASVHGHALGIHPTFSGTGVDPASGKRATTRSYDGISCVPYARQVSGILVSGNAWQWWRNASGIYARGDRPEAGSVLNFRANGRMRLGHVAVVTQVVNPREVIVDHANWPSGEGYGGVARNVAVVDVSEANNWSAVRVELGHAGNFGSVYPTYGFIYKRPDTGVVLTSVSRPAPQPAINPVPSDLRPVAERPWRMTEEVAESSAARPLRVNANANPVNIVR